MLVEPMVTNQSKIFLLVLLMLTVGLACAATAQQTTTYYPLSRGSNIDGILFLTNKTARFSERTGLMRLRLASEIDIAQIPETNSTRLSGADIYEVTNAQTYFRANQGKNGFCYKPLKWLTLTPEGRSMFWVCGFDIDKLEDYRPDKVGMCFCGMWEKFTDRKE